MKAGRHDRGYLVAAAVVLAVAAAWGFRLDVFSGLTGERREREPTRREPRLVNAWGTPGQTVTTRERSLTVTAVHKEARILDGRKLVPIASGDVIDRDVTIYMGKGAVLSLSGPGGEVIHVSGSFSKLVPEGGWTTFALDVQERR